MGRTPCCDSKGIKKGQWALEEDKLLVDYVQANGAGNWRMLPKLAGTYVRALFLGRARPGLLVLHA
jgi:hypothetical protein